MTTEYHVFTHQNSKFEQGFVFEIERLENNNQIKFNELWVVTSNKHGEYKIRLNLYDIFSTMGQNIGGNVEDSVVNEIVEVFKDVLPEQKQLEIQIDLCHKEIKRSTDDPAKQLIKASEYSTILYNESPNYLQGMLDNIIKKKYGSQEDN